MNRQIPRADIERFTATLAEKRRRMAKAEHQTRGYRDEDGVWRGGLLSFVRYFWHVLEPGTPFTNGTILEGMCEHLEAVTFGEITNLLINVPPGFAKPVQIDELVYTDRGFVRLGDIRVGDNVLTHKGRFRRVTAVHEQGSIPVVIVKTHNGRAIRAAPDHPFLTPRGWIGAGDLTDHDYVGSPLHQDHIKNNIVSPEEARLLGYLVGDGCISQRSLCFVNMDQEAIDDFIHCAKTLGFYAYVCEHPNKNVKASKVVLKSQVAKWKPTEGELPVLQWLKRHGLYRSNSYTKHIPDEVMASSAEIVANFLGAYWSCDGYVGIRHHGKKTTMMATATTVSHRLADDLQRALWIVGINARIRLHLAKLESKSQPGGTYASFNIGVCDRHEVSKVAKLPGLMTRKRILAEKAFLDHFEPTVFADAVLSVAPDGVAACRCLTVDEDCSFTVNGIAVHNSLISNVFFPAWEWGPMKLDHLRYVTFSYSSSNTERDNQRFGDLISSADFQAMYSHVTIRQRGMTMVSNEKHGWKLASSVSGSVTGKRGNRAICDDLNNVRESESQTVLESTNRWFRESLSSRLNNMETDAKIVIAQRTSEGDVSGEILNLGLPYDHFCVPMEFVWQADDNGDPYTTSIGWVDPRWTPDQADCEGELAWPERFSEKAVQSLKKELGPFAVAAQLQQTPEARGGGIFKREWWMPAEDVMSNDGQKYPPFTYLVASLDGAYTEKEENDPSALTVWGIFENEYGYNRAMLVHAWRKKLQFSGPRVDLLPGEHESVWRRRAMPHWGLIEWTADTCKRFKVDKLLIEAKATGISAAQSLQNSHGREGWSIQLVDPIGDKVARALAVQPTFSQEMVYAPDREWATMVQDEMAVFPKGRYKDLTDSTTQAIKHLRDSGLIRSDEERRAQELDAVKHRGAPKPPLYPGMRQRRA
jgi:predicted phage terminase large subunit-like protein